MMLLLDKYDYHFSVQSPYLSNKNAQPKLGQAYVSITSYEL